MHEQYDDTLGADSPVLLVKVGASAAAAADDGELYERARKWWRASPVQARRATRVLAVADKQVVAAWVPHRWEVSQTDGTTGKVAFHGTVAPDAHTFVGQPVAHLFPRGAANPIRYSTVGTVVGHAVAVEDDVAVAEPMLALLRINKSWRDDLTAEELLEATRGFWVMSPTRAEGLTRVLAVAHGEVREVYEPLAWSPSPVPGEEHRIGFEGRVADDRDRWVGTDVSAVFPHGSQNPVRYVALDDLAAEAEADAGLDRAAVPRERVEEPAATRRELRSSGPTLAEQVNPLLEALDGDLLWSMSRAAQELFHSNTIGWLMSRHPVAAAPLRAVFEGADPTHRLEVWREWKHLDLVATRADGRSRFVVENKMYSIPYAEQLERYAEKELPWSKGHGPAGAPDTAYVLLTLMDPTFPLPPPWRRASYEEVLRALETIDAVTLDQDAELYTRYRTLVRRLVELKDAVDPRQDLDAPFSVKSTIIQLHHRSFAGPLQRMRFTGLAQAVAEEYGERVPLVVDITRALGSLTYTRRLDDDRAIGWQLQEGQLRTFVLIRDRGLAGKGDERAAARARVAEAEYADFTGFEAVEQVLGDLLEPYALAPGVWRRFAPDFVYRYRKVSDAATTRQLAEALAGLTAYVEGWG